MVQVRTRGLDKAQVKSDFVQAGMYLLYLKLISKTLDTCLLLIAPGLSFQAPYATLGHLCLYCAGKNLTSRSDRVTAVTTQRVVVRPSQAAILFTDSEHCSWLLGFPVRRCFPVILVTGNGMRVEVRASMLDSLPDAWNEEVMTGSLGVTVNHK